MQLCFRNSRAKKRFEEVKQWHLKYVWFPRVIRFTDGTKCFVWLEYVQRKYQYDNYYLFAKYGTDGDWEYKSGRELN